MTILIGAAVFIIVALIGAVFYGIEYVFRASYLHQQAVERRQIGWLVLGNVNSSGREGSTTRSIPISAPYAEGHIIVVANKHANQWKFETLEVELDGQDERIPLLEPAP